MSNQRLPRIGLEARDDVELRGLLERSNGRNVETCLNEFRSYGMTKFIVSDENGIHHEITVRRVGCLD
jgi:hypothetical protein